MRVDPSRASALALWFAAMLAVAGSPREADAQGPPDPAAAFQRGAPPAAGAGGPAGGQAAGQGAYGPPGSSGPYGGQPGYPGQPGLPGQPGQPGAGAAAEGSGSSTREAPVDLDAVPVDTTPLARYIPEDSFGAFLEFNGLNAAPEVWQGSTAYALLNDTSLGAMLRELIAQFVEAAPDAPAGVMTGPEVVAVLEHLARQGLVIASPIDEQRAAGEAILVLRGAAHREVRPIFGKLIGTIAAEGARPKVEGRAGNRQVVVMDTPPFGMEEVSEWAWWIEGNDLVFVINNTESADRVIAVLDGDGPTAENDPIRRQLLAVENGFQPLAIGSLQLDRPGAGETERAMAAETGLSRVNLRWGFDGEDSLTILGLDAPSPREGFMAMFDQPSIAMGDLPPIPRDVDNLTILSVDPAGLYDALTAFAGQSAPPLAGPLESFEESVRSRGRLDFRDDVLAALGPKLAVYTLPKPASEPASGNPLAGIMNALGGLGLPQFVVAIELQDPSGFSSTLDGMILAINEQLATLLPPPAEGPAGAEAPGGFPPGGRQGGGLPGQAGGDRREEDPPEPPKFSMTLAQPRTYSLRLPEGLYGLTGYQPTITLGQKYLIVASNPVAARQCRELEQGDGSDRWSPPADLAGELPGNMTMLVVNDPRQSLPAAIAGLPAALNASLLAASSSGSAPNPGQAGQGGPSFPGEGRQRGGAASGPGGPPGSSGISGDSAEYGAAAPGFPGPGGSSPPPGSSGFQGQPGGPGYPGSPGGPGAPGGPGGQTAPTTIRLSPSLIPSADSLRRSLGTAVYSVSADDAGIRIEARESLPGQWSLDGLGSGATLSIPLPTASGGRN